MSTPKDDQEHPDADDQGKFPTVLPVGVSPPWYARFSLTDWITTISAAITALATVVIMGWAGLQWWEMHSGGIDTHALAEAAGQQASAASKSAQAAQDFASTAAIINGNINDAVGKLDAQAKATQRSANAAKVAADIASKQLALIDRPWIFVRFTPESAITFTNDQMNLSLRVHLNNVGRAVASQTVIAFDTFLTPHPFDVVSKRQKQLCEKTAKNIGDMSAIGVEMTLFPGAEDDSMSIGPSLKISDIRSNLVDTHNPSFHDVVFGPVYLVGCVDYQYSTSTAHHQTQFAFEIGRAGHAKDGSPIPYVTTLLKVDEDVPVGEVTMTRWIFGGDQAY